MNQKNITGHNLTNKKPTQPAYFFIFLMFAILNNNACCFSLFFLFFVNFFILRHLSITSFLLLIIIFLLIVSQTAKSSIDRIEQIIIKVIINGIIFSQKKLAGSFMAEPFMLKKQFSKAQNYCALFNNCCQMFSLGLFYDFIFDINIKYV